MLQKDSKPGFVLGNDMKEIQAHHNAIRIQAAKLANAQVSGQKKKKDPVVEEVTMEML